MSRARRLAACWVTLALSAALPPLGCRSLTRDTLTDDGAAGPADAADAADRARAAWNETPRTAAAVRRAAELMDTAARGSDAAYAELVDAARYAVWLARFDTDGDPDAKVAHGERAIVLTNTAIERDPERVAAYYFRAVAAGLVAEADAAFGLDAMDRIRDDARRAKEIDAAFEGAGPHRVLGGLYLESPGPPLGFGSLRRAERELRAAVELAPDHPGNRIFLARCLRQRADADTAKLRDELDRAAEDLTTLDDPFERGYWADELDAERRELK